MKDQYFGDINDYRKYGLLRTLACDSALRLGVCWMLTESDGRTDGSSLSYLEQPRKFRPHDPELFDWLHRTVHLEKDRRVARMEACGLLRDAVFHSSILRDTAAQRRDFFAEFRARCSGSDLVFFDPDNGMQIKSVAEGRKNSGKFLFWTELCECFAGGASVIVYQHFIRENRDLFTRRMVETLRARTGAAAVFSFTTPRVLFLLAAQEFHADFFRERLGVIKARWNATQIRALEHDNAVFQHIPREADLFSSE